MRIAKMAPKPPILTIRHSGGGGYGQCIGEKFERCGAAGDDRIAADVFLRMDARWRISTGRPVDSGIRTRMKRCMC